MHFSKMYMITVYDQKKKHAREILKTSEEYPPDSLLLASSGTLYCAARYGADYRLRQLIFLAAR